MRKDTAITQSRVENKYLLTLKEANEFKSALSNHLDSHNYKKGKLLTHISSVYFDTSNLDYFKKALSQPDSNQKIRIREYYYYNEELIEHALSKETLYELEGVMYVEIKKRSSEGTTKQRLQITKELLNTIVLEKPPLEIFEKELALLTKENLSDDFIDFFRANYHNVIKPVSAVHYSRNAYENKEGTLRISLDKGLSFHKFDLDQVNVKKIHKSWRKDYLPESIKEEGFLVLEVKFIKELPEWLRLLLVNYKQLRYSKFSACMQACYGV